MTVAELIEILEGFDPDMEIVIGMKQRYGTDFAMEIIDVSVNKVDVWDAYSSVYDEDEYPECVVITEGPQIGGVCYEHDDNNDDDY